MPVFFSSAQSFWPVYMVVADGFLSSDVLQISKRQKIKSFTAAISFFMPKETEIQNEREVQGNMCVSVKNGKMSFSLLLKGKELCPRQFPCVIHLS